MVIGTLLILGYLALVLLDSGSTHSFISTSFVNQIELELESLGSVLFVSTPTGVDMIASERVRNYQITVCDRALDVSLLVLNMRGFNVILGIKWLTNNLAFIDYFRKEVVFRLLTQPSFKFKGCRMEECPRPVSALKAEKVIS